MPLASMLLSEQATDPRQARRLLNDEVADGAAAARRRPGIIVERFAEDAD